MVIHPTVLTPYCSTCHALCHAAPCSVHVGASNSRALASLVVPNCPMVHSNKLRNRKVSLPMLSQASLVGLTLCGLHPGARTRMTFPATLGLASPCTVPCPEPVWSPNDGLPIPPAGGIRRVRAPGSRQSLFLLFEMLLI